MTNGRGQIETIRENIFRKYGRYQVHGKSPDEYDKKTEPKLKDLLTQLLEKQAAEKEETPEETQAAVIANVLQDIHDRNNR